MEIQQRSKQPLTTAWNHFLATLGIYFMLHAEPLQAPASVHSVVAGALQHSALSEQHDSPFSQHPALLMQHSHSQDSQVQTPVSQQQTPPSQHWAQTHSALLVAVELF
jgi:hypothetical protein